MEEAFILLRLQYTYEEITLVSCFSFLGWSETESTRYVGHYFTYCTSHG
jgi:hypothetical protein